MDDEGKKTCEVMCLDWKPGATFRARPCGGEAAYFVRGCVGPVEGKAFVCEEHKNFYSPRIMMEIGEYWAQQAEESFRDKKGEF